MSGMKTSNLTIETLKKMFGEGKRFDGRGLLDHRELSIELGVSNKAEGSAGVRLGKTEVMVGVKLGLGTPYPDSPNSGNLMVSADLLPMASPRFEQGPPKFPAIELTRIIDRGIRESGMIDLSKLVIEPGEKVWTLFIDIYPINDDGNLIDASNLAAIAALKSAIMPGVDTNGNVDYKNRTTTKLPLSDETAPIVFTFYKLGDSIILDPTREEEEACDTRITFGVSSWNGQIMVNSSQKSGGDTPMTQEEIGKIVSALSEKYKEFDAKLKKVL